MYVLVVIQLPANGLQKQVWLRIPKEVQDLEIDYVLSKEKK